MLVQSEKLASLGRMSAGLAHEIRNPLTAIKMLIFSLQREVKKDSRKTKDFAVIIKEIERMENFLQNFLDFARPPEPNFDLVDINEVVRDTLDLLSPQFRNHKIELIEQLFPDNIKVFGDKEQLQIVLVNIMLNGIQSMPDGGELKVATTLQKSSNEFDSVAQIQISDSGAGIPAELMDTIFDPFVSGTEKGTGLGLSIAYQIINNHNGWIEAMNNSTRGATFIVKLPMKKGITDAENFGSR
jgi:signal transduction histidine kinase